MPVYEYKCSCGQVFEKILNKPENFSVCVLCGNQASRKVVRISKSVFTQRTGNEDIDVIVGADAEKRHKFCETRYKLRQEQKKRLGTNHLTITSDGEAHRMSEDKAALRNEYSKSFKENRVVDAEPISIPETARNE